MMTGAYPAESGIIGNEWPDRASGKYESSVSDDKTKLLGDKPERDRIEPAPSDEFNDRRRVALRH